MVVGNVHCLRASFKAISRSPTLDKKSLRSQVYQYILLLQKYMIFRLLHPIKAWLQLITPSPPLNRTGNLAPSLHPENGTLKKRPRPHRPITTTFFTMP